MKIGAEGDLGALSHRLSWGAYQNFASATFGKMFILVINGLNHPRRTLFSSCPLALSCFSRKTNKQTSKQQNKTYQHIRFASYLEAFRGCKGISIRVLVYKNCSKRLAKLLTLDKMPWISLPLPREAGCAGSEGGLQARFGLFPQRGARGLGRFPQCWVALRAAGGAVGRLQAAEHPGTGPAAHFQSLWTSGCL